MKSALSRTYQSTKATFDIYQGGVREHIEHYQVYDPSVIIQPLLYCCYSHICRTGGRIAEDTSRDAAEGHRADRVHLACLEHIAIASSEHLGLFHAEMTNRPRYMQHILAWQVVTCCDHDLTGGQGPLPQVLLQLLEASYT